MSHEPRTSPVHFGQGCQAIVTTAILALTGLFVAPTLIAQEDRGTALSDDQLIRPVVSETTIVIMKIEPARLLPSPQGENESDPSTNQPSEGNPLFSLLEEQEVTGAWLKKLHEVLHEVRNVTNDMPIFIMVDIPKSKQEAPFTLVVKRSSGESSERVTGWLENFGRWKVAVRGDLIVASGALPTIVPKSSPAVAEDGRPALAEAFAAVSDYPIQVLFVPPEHLWRTVRELMTDLPAQLGGGPSSLLTEGVQWGALGVDPGQLRMQLTIQSRSEEDAQNFSEYLPILLRSCYRAAAEFHEVGPEKLFDSLVTAMKPTVRENQVIVTMNILDVGRNQLDMFLKLAQAAEAGMQRQEDLRLRQILIAMHNYHDTYGEFPPANRHRDSEGKLGLSWRVHLLPFLGESDLHREFRLDEPWDSEHNQELLTRMPEIYSRSSRILDTEDRPAPGYTTLLAPAGEDAVFGGETSHSLGHIVDGTSNTVVLVEVMPERAVPWTAPQDFVYDPDNPLDGILIHPDERWMAGMADGSLQWFRSGASARTILHLFQKSDGHPIPMNELQ